jgi:predicted nucleic acid-binding protein
VKIIRGFELIVSSGRDAAGAAIRNESARKGRPISSADAWIAATAMIVPAPLVTNNPNDYSHLDNLQLVSAAAT